MALALSALDLVPVSEGFSSGRAVHDSLELAGELDRLGYQRVWYAEHHNMPAIASTNPATLIALAAQRTQRIRVGSGGVMLPNHSPLQVAETFKLLESIYPGRIDLGIGRAPGTDQVTALALRRSREALLANDFPDQLAELMDFGAGLQRSHPFVGVNAYPDDTSLPPIFLLGSSGFSSALAAKLGLAFGFAAHFSPDRPDVPMLAYRSEFQPSEYLEAPHAILTLSVICAETAAEAERLASSMQLSWVRLRSGRPSKIPSPETALAFHYSDQEAAVAHGYRQMQIVGTPETVRERIEALAHRTRADEVMLTTVTHDPAARLRSYELLAAAFALH
ncbi:MAG TPA: LLM class flavin-dependent oxidoreductase [Polyangiaceae bacterium]|nr:LLM class flavin-dependent oxidoreductase [Polyangiaceae bacterium]